MLRLTRKFRTAKARQRQRRKHAGIAALGGICLATLIALSHLDRFAIAEIEVTGNGTLPAEAIDAVAREALAGTRWYAVARDNVLLFPRGALKARLRESYPRLASIELDVSADRTLSIAVSERKPDALWCGDVVPPISASSVAGGDTLSGRCYFTDTAGLIFAQAPQYTGAPYHRFYGAIGGSEEIGSTFLPPEEYRRMRAFLDTLADDGIDPRALLVVDEQEYELYIAGGTRVLFMREQATREVRTNLLSVLQAASDESRGSAVAPEYVYIDLRFGNKAYVKARE